MSVPSVLLRRIGVASCLIAAVIAAGSLGRTAPVKERKINDADLRLIPAGAQMAFAFRVADLYKSDLGKEGLKRLPAQTTDELKKWETRFDMTPADIERIVIIAEDVKQDQALITFLTKKALEPKKILDAIATTPATTAPEEKKLGEFTLYLFKPGVFFAGTNTALCFLNDHLAVFGDEAGVTKILEKKATKPEGPIAEAMAKVNERPVVMALSLTKAMKDSMRPGIQDDYKLLLEADTVTLDLGLDKGFDVRVSAAFPDEGTARDAVKVAISGKRALAALLSLGKPAITDKNGIKMVDAVEKMLKDAKIDQDDKEVIAKAKLDIDLVAWIELMTGPFGPFGGAVPPIDP